MVAPAAESGTQQSGRQKSDKAVFSATNNMPSSQFTLFLMFSTYYTCMSPGVHGQPSINNVFHSH